MKDQAFKEFKALFKKDLSFLFKKKVAFFIFGGPFLLMLFMIGIPTLFGSTEPMVVRAYSADIGVTNINVGDNIIGNLSIYYGESRTIEIELVNSFEEINNTDELGLFISENFTATVYEGNPTLYFVDKKQNPFSNQAILEIRTIARNVVATTLANRTIPQIATEDITPTTQGGQDLLGYKAATLAYPLGYMIFLLISLNSSSSSLIGFGKEKRMRTMEMLLAYVKNHSLLIISKALTGLIAALGSTLSYLLGIILSYSFSDDDTESFFSIFGFDIQAIGVGNVIIVFLFAVLALFISTLMTMAVDTNLKREASERLSPLIAIGFAFFFYFVIIIEPLTVTGMLMINPFFWCYRLALLIVSRVFNYEVIVYPSLILVSLIALIFLSTKGIQKEKTLYLD